MDTEQLKKVKKSVEMATAMRMDCEWPYIHFSILLGRIEELGTQLEHAQALNDGLLERIRKLEAKLEVAE